MFANPIHVITGFIEYLLEDNESVYNDRFRTFKERDAAYECLIKETEGDAISSVMDSTRLAYGITCFLSHVAHADGFYSNSERVLIQKIVQEFVPDVNFNPDPKSQSESQKHISSLLEKAFTDDTTPKVLFTEARENTELRKSLLAFGWRVVAADGRVAVKEIEIMTKLAFEMHSNMIEIEWSALPYYRVHGFESDKEKLCDYLDLTTDVSFEDIKKAYKSFLDKFEHESENCIEEKKKNVLINNYTVVKECYLQTVNNWQNTNWYGFNPFGKDIAPAKDLNELRCIVCNKKIDTPETKDFSSVRCPKCQALLLYPEEDINLLIE